MEPNNDLQEPEILVEIADADALASVEDFIKELEAKEKDLHITADYQIEVEDSDVDDAIPDFVQQEVETQAKPKPPVRESHVAEQPGLKTKVYELEREVEHLETKLRELRSERNDVQEKSDRRLKDFENYKYRMDRERRGSFIDQISNLASQMLPVLDNLDRALDAALASPEKDRDEFKQFFDGMMLVHHQIHEVFGGMGVEPIKSVGETFDPNFHEAVTVEERSDLPANTILDEMLRGYRIGNRVIRHSMVKVTTSTAPAKKGGKAEKQAVAAVEDTDPTAIPAPTELLPEDDVSFETE